MELNERIKQLIDYYTDGVVARFSKAINLPAQTVNRLFNIDTRTNKFPTATTEVLQKIAERYEDVSLEWLLLGKGNMFKSKQPPENNEKDLIIELLKENNTLLKNEITRLKLQQNAH